MPIIRLPESLASQIAAGEVVERLVGDGDEVLAHEGGGFARAVEMCNGAGVCRKLSDGVMCPSFMATRDEEHSTRGRANALRAAISGDLKTQRVMVKDEDMCLHCGLCAERCPTGAWDMQKFLLDVEHAGPKCRERKKRAKAA